MYKIIACDLDETLLSDDRSISKENIEAIQKAKELGVKFVPATGRGYNTVDGTLKELGLYDLENEYVISYNGGAISENKGSKLLHFEGITFEKASELYKRGLNYDVCIHVYTKDMVYAYKFVQEEIDYLAGRMEVKEIFDDHIDFLKGQEIVKVLYMNTDYDYLKKIEDDLKDGFLSILKIEPFLHKKAKALSGGMQKRLSIACALASRPTLLLLDEPDAALDLVCKEDIREYIRLYCAQGNTVLLATHEEADFDLCSKLILLKDGHARTLAADTPVKEIIEYLS